MPKAKIRQTKLPRQSRLGSQAKLIRLKMLVLADKRKGSIRSLTIRFGISLI